MESLPLVLAIVGPTATGKSSLAISVAEHLGAEIISVDSVQAYRGMNIGSAKPSASQQARVPHSLIDICDPSEELDADTYRGLALSAIDDATRRGRLPMLVGGSALYFTAATAPVSFRPTDRKIRADLEAEFARLGLAAMVERLVALDPKAAGSIDIANPRRVIRSLEVALIEESANRVDLAHSAGGPARLAESPGDFPVAVIGVTLSLPTRLHDQRIRDRVEAMLSAGLVDEVRSIFGTQDGHLIGPNLRNPPSRTARQALGYKEIAGALAAGDPVEHVVPEIIARTRRLARRQRAWFRRDHRLAWISADPADEAARVIAAYMERRIQHACERMAA